MSPATPKATEAESVSPTTGDTPKPKSATKPAPDTTGPNKPLKFRLEKLEPNHPYLTERGLTPETIATFGLGFCTKGVMASHIAIPISNADGQLVAYAGRYPGEPPEGTPK